jgi:hypothetical protein
VSWVVGAVLAVVVMVAKLSAAAGIPGLLFP